jgi:hypothetical protein
MFILWNIRICASWSDNPLGSSLMVKLVLLNIPMKILSIAVDEQLLILAGKSTILYKSYDAHREYNWSLLLVLSR